MLPRWPITPATSRARPVASPSVLQPLSTRRRSRGLEAASAASASEPCSEYPLLCPMDLLMSVRNATACPRSVSLPSSGLPRWRSGARHRARPHGTRDRSTPTSRPCASSARRGRSSSSLRRPIDLFIDLPGPRDVGGDGQDADGCVKVRRRVWAIAAGHASHERRARRQHQEVVTTAVVEELPRDRHRLLVVKDEAHPGRPPDLQASCQRRARPEPENSASYRRAPRSLTGSRLSVAILRCRVLPAAAMLDRAASTIHGVSGFTKEP